MAPPRARRLALRLPPCLAALLLCCPGAAPAPAAPGGLTASVSLEPAEIHVGDTARLVVVVEHPAAGRLDLPELGRGKAIVVGDRSRKTVPVDGGQRQRTTVELALTSFELGEHGLGGGMIAFTGPTATPTGIPFPASTLRTRSILRSADTPLRGIKGLARWPARQIPWAGLAAGLSLLAAAVVLVLRRRRPGSLRSPAPPPRSASAHDAALKALAGLGAGLPLRPERIEPFYLELSAIARRYLEERFGLRAAERTTEEFIREAADSGLLAPRHREMVRDFLGQCDLVKFARQRPGPQDATLALEAAVRLVRETPPPAREAAT